MLSGNRRSWAARFSHEEIDAGLAQFGAAEDAVQARDHLLGTISLARRHSYGQEQWLFPMARRLLGETALQALGAEWCARRGIGTEPVPGSGTARARYHAGLTIPRREASSPVLHAPGV